MVTGSGALRAHWRSLMETVWSLEPEQLAEKQARVAAQIAEADEILAMQEHGAGPPPRSLDLLPLILSEAEWRTIAAGLAQRARLLEAILADLYGPQRLIEERLLPPYLVLGNPAFLRPLRRVRPPGNAPYLHVYAADLVRWPGGEWRVFADRTQAAAGVGYALHHRSVLARIFPEAFRGLQVRRLQSFTELWQTSLRGIGGTLAAAPHIVLLTPGPYNDAYFEHVLLARELGITLVQSADLTVRSNVVYLKALEGLIRVDVIYRRVDGDYCDSLELREESELGVAGLVGAARAGNVALLNMPGSALVETPAFAPFLPELSRRLLGEELRLSAVTTWWCGQRAALAEVRSALDRFVLQPVFDSNPVPLDPALLSAHDRALIEERLTAEPQRYVARESIPPSVVPCLDPEEAASGQSRFRPQPAVLRVVAVWQGGDWVALPGGVARVVAGQSIYGNALRHGGIAKDVWVLSDEDQDIRLPAPAITSAPAQSRREEVALRSRTADDLYWLGRYVERLDAGARQLLATLHRLASGGLSARDHAELGRLAEALRRAGWIAPSVAAAPVSGVMFLAGITDSAAGGRMMRNCMDAIRRLTFASRDQLSVDMWHALHHLTGPVTARLDGERREPDTLIEELEGTIATVAAFAGLAAENMTRGAGWRFLDLGRRIERGIAIAQAIHGVMSGPVTQIEAGLRLSLELCDSTTAYLRYYSAESRFGRALEFVLADRSNPRAFLYQIERIHRHLSIQAATGGARVAPTIIPALVDRVEAFSSKLAHPGGVAAEITALFDLLDHGAGALMGLSDAIARAFFTHATSARLRGGATAAVTAGVEA